MALIRWLRPRELPQLGGWDLWRLREVGAWGDLGRRVGARWEEVGGAALATQFAAPVVPLWQDRALTRWLGTLGLRNPDALLVESGLDGRATVRPIDLKWSLDTADYGQIGGERLRQLFEKAGDRLGALLPPSSGPPRFGDGLFVSPERLLNRLFLRSAANAKKEYPIEVREVRLVRIDVPAFFAPLPGWATARRLAELERVSPEELEGDIELADRYYHLGVGVWGALSAADRSLFAEREGLADDDLLVRDDEVEAAVARRLEALIARLGARGARELVRELATAHAERTALRQERRGLERLPYRFPDFLDDARKAKLPTEDEATIAKLRELYKELGRTHQVELRALGRELVAAGRTDAEALSELKEREGEMKRAARRRARELLRDLG
jgi:hypothetical protein